MNLHLCFPTIPPPPLFAHFLDYVCFNEAIVLLWEEPVLVSNIIVSEREKEQGLYVFKSVHGPYTDP